MKKEIGLILVFAFIFVACQQTNFEQEIDTIDSLLVKLDTIDLRYRRIDTTGFSDMGQTFSEKLSFVQGVYTKQEDTMPKATALLMSEYRTLKKPAKGFHNTYQMTGEELTFSKTQLADLKHDLQNNLLDSLLVHEMLEDELQAVKSIENRVQDLKLSSEFTKAKRAELEPRIDSLIQALKQEES